MLHRLFVRTIASAALVVAPVVALAQAPALTPGDAAPFLGTWALTLQTPHGNFEQTLTLKNTNGKILGEIANPMQPGAQPIDDISKSGNDLVMKFQGDFQGMAFAATLTMTPDGADKANCTFDVMNGQFVMQGTAVKK